MYMLNRKNFEKIIKMRSFYKIDKRKGNYRLPCGKLSEYVKYIVESQMNVDNLAIAENGDLYTKSVSKDDKKFIIFSEKNEVCSCDEQDKRISKLVSDIIL